MADYNQLEDEYWKALSRKDLGQTSAGVIYCGNGRLEYFVNEGEGDRIVAVVEKDGKTTHLENIHELDLSVRIPLFDSMNNCP